MVIYTYKPNLTAVQKEELGREQKFRDKLAYDTRQWIQNYEAVLERKANAEHLHLFMKSLDTSQQALFDYQFRSMGIGLPSPQSQSE